MLTEEADPFEPTWFREVLNQGCLDTWNKTTAHTELTNAQFRALAAFVSVDTFLTWFDDARRNAQLARVCGIETDVLKSIHAQMREDAEARSSRVCSQPSCGRKATVKARLCWRHAVEEEERDDRETEARLKLEHARLTRCEGICKNGVRCRRLVDVRRFCRQHERK